MTRRMTHLYGWMLVFPTVVLLAAFTHLPAVATFWHSLFTTPRGNRPARFSGLDSYTAMLNDAVFWQSLSNNVVFAVATIPLSVVLALLMALLVNGKLKGRTAMRVAFFTPTVLPMIAVANIWMFFYTPSYGLLDQIGGLFGLAPHNWLGDRDTAMPAIIAVTVWKEAGFFMIFYLAALQQIPRTLLEAAALEGASRWTVFRRITVPLVMPTTLFVLINAIINAFRMIDHIVVMTRGGPDNATMLLLFYVWEVGFKFWDTSYAAALTMVLLAILVVIAVGQFLYLDRRIHYR